MTNAIETIALKDLAIALIPVAVVLAILWRWALEFKTGVYALLRMLVQLLAIGYVLTSVFSEQNVWLVVAMVGLMILCASWIALRTIDLPRSVLYAHALAAIVLGGGSTLVIITAGVLKLDPWYLPHKLIPLAGMVFANAMTAISIAIERLTSELKQGIPYTTARGTALRAALIPITNALFAVGLVSLPGMMTGMLINEADPLVAARYQIMVMCMIYGSCGISAALFLIFIRNKVNDLTGPSKD